MSQQARHAYEFGPFRLDTAERLLLREGKPVALTPKAYEMLLALLQRSGHIVGKDELLKEVWPGQFVEEGNLTQHVFALRRALGENRGEPQYIETIPRRGYRFVAEVQISDGELVVEKQASARLTFKAERPRTGMIDSLAVLPFTNVGANKELEYLSDGITESIINTLSHLSTLRVTARSTVFRFKGREIDVQELGRELRVGAVLTGRVLHVGGRLIVRAELVETLDGWQLWGAQYNREPSDIFALEEELAREISDNLQLKLSGREERLLTKRHTENMKAYHAYLKGRYSENKRTEEGLKQGIEYFQQAIDLDPCYALAYSGLADCYAVLGVFGGLEPADAFPKAKAASQKAVEIDETLAEAYTSLAFIKQEYDWDWSGAEKGYRAAIARNPHYPLARFWYATCLAATGRPDESIAEIQRALELDPLSLPINTYLGWALYLARRYDRAVEQLRKTLELDKNFVQARWRLGLAYEQKGMYTEAIAEFQAGAAVSQNNPLMISALGHAYAMFGRKSAAIEMLAELDQLAEERYVSPYHRALIYLGLGEREQALRWLDKSYRDRSGFVLYLKVEPLFDSLRRDARFVELLRGLGLTASERPEKGNQ